MDWQLDEELHSHILTLYLEHRMQGGRYLPFCLTSPSRYHLDITDIDTRRLERAFARHEEEYGSHLACARASDAGWCRPTWEAQRPLTVTAYVVMGYGLQRRRHEAGQPAG